MNANQLWAGNDYAYADYRPKGVPFVHGGKRVRVIRVYQEKDYGSERARSMVHVLMLTDEGEPRKAYSGGDLEQKVRARDIFMRWDEYEDERTYRNEQAEKIEHERRQKEERAQNAKARLTDALEAKGIERTAISTVSDYAVTINRAVLESWLGLDVDGSNGV
jgi:hypothetical protein